jgi:hypothetical protein
MCLEVCGVTRFPRPKVARTMRSKTRLRKLDWSMKPPVALGKANASSEKMSVE